MKVIQVLPALNAGGVERGTVEFARELVARGHESVVVSSGGRLVERLQQEGSRHITMPVHKKSLFSLLQVRPMRGLLAKEKPDVVHVRSRIPAWIVWLAWRKLPAGFRPRLVSTFHGMYSINAYSAIMAKAEATIAISNCVQAYMHENYAETQTKTTLIPRGLDDTEFATAQPSQDWFQALWTSHPELKDKKLVLMPGRLSRWKGQEDFVRMMAELVKLRQDCHGVVLGEAEPNKAHYEDELKALAAELGVGSAISFLGHRQDIAQFYACASVTCHMSQKAEPFGRTVPEAIACGCPVVAYDRGGAAESLVDAYPEGLVAVGDIAAFAERVAQAIEQRPALALPEKYYLHSQVESTLGVYQRLLAVQA